ncbi:MAG: hypothetical protein WED13_09280, partial [Methyloceanibacter sp.]
MRETQAAKAIASVVAALLVGCISPAFAAEHETTPLYPVGVRQIEFTDGDRHVALVMFYPAVPLDKSATPFAMPFFTNLHLYKDAPQAAGRYKLVMFSHGRGSNPLSYAWFAETLASHGYIVAG